MYTVYVLHYVIGCSPSWTALAVAPARQLYLILSLVAALAVQRHLIESLTVVLAVELYFIVSLSLAPVS